MLSILRRLFRREPAKRGGAEPPAGGPTVEAEKAETWPEAPVKTSGTVSAPEAAIPVIATRPRPKPKRRRKKASEKGGKQGLSASSRNRHGIPVFKKDADISRLFETRPEEKIPGGEDLSHDGTTVGPPPRKIRRRPRNKNGIPVFGETTDFSVYFRDAPTGTMTAEEDGWAQGGPVRPEAQPDEFQGLLEASLAGKTKEALLRAKRDGGSGENPLTPEQAIRRYPPPQEELDLHGKTSQEAVDSTRAFVERSRYRGKRTLLIIVGKGLHSNGRAILPDVVEAELARLRQEGRVLAHRWERGAKRKSGAIIVYLNPL